MSIGPMQNKKYTTKKRFGQNFLHDQAILNQIILSFHPSDSDHIIEIGPGQGAVTTLLLEKVKHITAIEIDRDLIEQLKKKFSEAQLTLIPQDILKTNLCDKQLVSNAKNTDTRHCEEAKPTRQSHHPFRLIGNLPYNISTPLLFHLFNQLDVIKDMHFMLQKEVAERICAKLGSSQYGRLSVMSQYYCDAEILFYIGPESFDPPPKVESAFIRLTPKKEKLDVQSFSVFEKVVLDAFNQRRKTIANSLKKQLNADDWKALKIDSKKRPQELMVADFVKISNHLGSDPKGV